MKQGFLCIIVILGLAGLLILATAKADDARTNRLYARAHLVEAKSAANQALLAGLMPYTILGLATIGGVIATIALTWPRPTPPPQIIERQIIERQTIIVLQPGQTRRDVWRQFEKSPQSLGIED